LTEIVSHSLQQYLFRVPIVQVEKDSNLKIHDLHRWNYGRHLLEPMLSRNSPNRKAFQFALCYGANKGVTILDWENCSNPVKFEASSRN